MKSLEPTIPGTFKQGLKLEEYVTRNKLLRMLRNTLQRYPKARVGKRRGAYGVSMQGGGYLRVSYSVGLDAEQQRDLLVLLATWLVADPNALLNQNTPLDGSS